MPTLFCLAASKQSPFIEPVRLKKPASIRQFPEAIESKQAFGGAAWSIYRQLSYGLKLKLFFAFFILPTSTMAGSIFLRSAIVGANVSIPMLFSGLDPTSVSQHFAFYELYPQTHEGRQALKIGWDLLNGGSLDQDSEFLLPAIDLQPILSLVNRSDRDDQPQLNTTQLEVIGKLSKHLGNRKLKGFDLWDLETILKLPADQVDLGRTLLIAEMGSNPRSQASIQSYEASLDMMALQILARLKPNAKPEEKIRAVNEYIFSQMRFRFPPHSLHAKDIDIYTFLPSVLDSRRGVCLGVSILYLCLAQRIDLPLQAITPPGHIYVRYVDEEGKITNIETTARGIDIPTEQYQGLDSGKLQERSIRECVGLAFMNQAAASWHHEDSETAIELYQKAKLFLGEDYLLNLFLAFNYLSNGKVNEARSLLEKIKGRAEGQNQLMQTVAEDYLAGRVDSEGIEAIFCEVDETRQSILQKISRLENTVKKFPLFRQGYFHLAVAWMQLGRQKEALPHLEKYTILNPWDPTSHYYLAAIQFQRHNFKNAWKYLHLAEAIADKSNQRPKALLELRRALRKQCPEEV